MLSKKLALEILNKGLATGADFAEIYYEDTLSKGLSTENGKLEVLNSSIINGVGIRLLKDLRSVYGYTNDLSKKGLYKLVESLAASFEGERIITVEKIKKVHVKEINKVETPFLSVPTEEIAQLLKKTSSIIRWLPQTGQEAFPCSPPQPRRPAESTKCPMTG